VSAILFGLSIGGSVGLNYGSVEKKIGMNLGFGIFKKIERSIDLVFFKYGAPFMFAFLYIAIFDRELISLTYGYYASIVISIGAAVGIFMFISATLFVNRLMRNGVFHILLFLATLQLLFFLQIPGIFAEMDVFACEILQDRDPSCAAVLDAAASQ